MSQLGKSPLCLPASLGATVWPLQGPTPTSLAVTSSRTSPLTPAGGSQRSLFSSRLFLTPRAPAGPPALSRSRPWVKGCLPRAPAHPGAHAGLGPGGKLQRAEASLSLSPLVSAAPWRASGSGACSPMTASGACPAVTRGPRKEPPPRLSPF